MALQSKINYRAPTTMLDEPDGMWQMEAGKIAPWFAGRGADIGCGLRTIKQDTIRVDCDQNVKPEVLCGGDKLPFKDGELDYISSIHSFEHFEDQKAVLKEWLRVVKDGGVVGIVHPDVQYTKRQEERETNESLRNNPFNKHYHECTHEQFINMITTWQDLPFVILDHGVACGNWSFYVVLQKREKSAGKKGDNL